MLQLTPEPPGSASLKDRPFAAPAPVLAIVTVNPIESPALTLAASAVLVMTRCGQLTVIATGPTDGLPSFVELAAVLFFKGPQVPAVLGPVPWPRTSEPAARSTPLAPPKLRMPLDRV